MFLFSKGKQLRSTFLTPIAFYAAFFSFKAVSILYLKRLTLSLIIWYKISSFSLYPINETCIFGILSALRALPSMAAPFFGIVVGFSLCLPHVVISMVSTSLTVHGKSMAFLLDNMYSREINAK